MCKVIVRYCMMSRVKSALTAPCNSKKKPNLSYYDRTPNLALYFLQSQGIKEVGRAKHIFLQY